MNMHQASTFSWLFTPMLGERVVRVSLTACSPLVHRRQAHIQGVEECLAQKREMFKAALVSLVLPWCLCSTPIHMMLARSDRRIMHTT